MGAPLPVEDVLEHVEEPGRTIALTFDDGPNPRDTAALLEVLARERVPAVFCLVGEQVQAHPAVVRRIAGEGHVLGNHSFHHDDMQAWEPDAVLADLERTSSAIRAAVPGADVPFFRAPYGRWGVTVPVAAGLGMRALGWALAVADWEPPGVDVLVSRLEEVPPGGIVLLHDGGGDRSQTVAAVATLILLLRQRGWTFTVPRPTAAAGR